MTHKSWVRVLFDYFIFILAGVCLGYACEQQL